MGNNLPKELHECHRDMVSNRRFGKVILQYESGRITTVRQEQMVKVRESPGTGGPGNR